MATVVIDPKMDIDLPRTDAEEDCYYEERKEVARVRVMESARGSGEMNRVVAIPSRRRGTDSARRVSAAGWRGGVLS